jgi:hypothetical protein
MGTSKYWLFFKVPLQFFALRAAKRAFFSDALMFFGAVLGGFLLLTACEHPGNNISVSASAAAVSLFDLTAANIAPVTGETRKIFVSANQYNAVLIWKTGDTVDGGMDFAPSTVYTADMLLSAREGSTFKGITPATRFVYADAQVTFKMVNEALPKLKFWESLGS